MKKIVLFALALVFVCSCLTSHYVEMTQAEYDYKVTEMRREYLCDSLEHARIMVLPSKEWTKQDTIFMQQLKDGQTTWFRLYFEVTHAKIVKEKKQ